MPTERILVVDDSEVTLDVLERNLTAAGYGVTCATGALMALELLDSEPFDLLVTDLRMPGMGGMELLRVARERHPDLPAMMITGYATVPGAVEALRGGAAEYLPKPFTNGELLQDGGTRPREGPRCPSCGAPPLTGHAAAVRPGGCLPGHGSGLCRPRARRLFRSGAGPARGPCGHRSYGRRAGPGGRRALRGGAVRVAPPDRAQDPVGAGRGRHAVPAGPGFRPRWRARGAGRAVRRPALPRLLVGCSPALVARAGAGRLPRGLYETLARQIVFLPPLRERQEDVPRVLLSLFRRAIAPAPFPCWPLFSASLVEQLAAYPWPGNVAELQDVAAHLLARLAGQTLGPSDLPARLRSPVSRAGPTLAEVEAEHIRCVLEQVAGNKSRAAEMLGIDRKTLREKLKAAGAKEERPERSPRALDSKRSAVSR